MEEKIRNFLLNQDISCEVYRKDKDTVAVSIIWGDWKHVHARVKYLVNVNFSPVDVVTEVTEEDGSDCYSAVHLFTFK